MMIKPFLQDDALLADMAAASHDENTLHVWWLGQSGFLVQWAGERLLFDPYLSDSLTRKYATTDKPHVRMTERCVDPALLTGISMATASHVHTDHLDGETLVPLVCGNTGLRLVLPHPILDEARKRLGDAASNVELCSLSDGEVITHGRWEIRGVVAKHNEVVRDAEGRSAYIGFIVKCGPFTIYHSGDTLWHDDIVQTLRDHAPQCDIAFLPINGNKPERRVAGNLNGTEAAALAKACGVRLVVPCHYEMFEFNTATPEEFIAACRHLGQACKVMRCGERIELSTEH
ncbi:MAG: MBL fold metallo-hydrolase [Prosthecobacter sp.]